MKYDLHVHTNYSPCASLKPEVLLKIAKKKVGLDGIAITDHNTIKGAIKVSKLNKDKDFEVIVGSEVYTNRGHLLGLYLTEDVKEWDFFSAVEKIHRQGGIAIIAHPFDIFPRLRFKKNGVDLGLLDAVECNNGRLFYFTNKKALRFAEENKMAKVAGSDAHFSFELGRAYTVFDGELRDAIKRRKTTIKSNHFFGSVGKLLSFIKATRIPFW